VQRHGGDVPRSQQQDFTPIGVRLALKHQETGAEQDAPTMRSVSARARSTRYAVIVATARSPAARRASAVSAWPQHRRTAEVPLADRPDRSVQHRHLTVQRAQQAHEGRPPCERRTPKASDVAW